MTIETAHPQVVADAAETEDGITRGAAGLATTRGMETGTARTGGMSETTATRHETIGTRGDPAAAVEAEKGSYLIPEDTTTTDTGRGAETGIESPEITAAISKALPFNAFILFSSIDRGSSFVSAPLQRYRLPEAESG